MYFTYVRQGISTNNVKLAQWKKYLTTFQIGQFIIVTARHNGS